MPTKPDKLPVQLVGAKGDTPNNRYIFSAAYNLMFSNDFPNFG